MDDIVRQAMAKWPKVPFCYGWLGLDARGRWYLRDEQAQTTGPFADGAEAGKGSLLEHEKLIAFIGRNYEADDAGQWYFQNGPQRVYVELAATPFIWRLEAGQDAVVTAHTGQATRVEHCIVDEQGHVYLQTPLGFGLVHSQDVPLAAEAVEAGRWSPQEMPSDTLASRFGFVRSPQSAQALRQP
jgi:hypothetical protein